MSMERIQTGHAALAVDSGDTPSQESTIVHGVAIGEGDVTIGGSGKQTYWPRETLREAAEGLTGQPLATDTDHTADNPQAQTPVEAIAGEITWAGYEPGVGVVYEAEVDDESLAKKIQNGRLEVSPLVSRELEPLEEDTADFKATEITRWRDLALVANGAAPSNEIQVGESPMQAEALHGLVESLQDGPALSDSVDVPERVQNAAQAALDADDNGLIPDSCGTGTGSSRARSLADNDVEVNDFLTRGGDDKTPIPAYLNSHAEDATTDDPPTQWGEDEWQSCGNAGLARWGWYTDWFRSKANELAGQRGEDEPYESMSAQPEALKTVAGVTFDGTATGELDESAIPSDGYESHYIYPGDTKSESAYPVVDADGNLRKGNVDAAWSLGARGRDEDEHDAMLMELAGEFEDPPEWAMDDAESMADMADVSEDTLVKWNSSGDRPAFGRVVDVRGEGDEPLDGEIDGDQTITPPAALIEVHRPADGGFEATDTMVGHKLNTDTLTVIEDLPDPESLAMHEENMAEVPDSMQFDNPGEAMAKAQEMGLEEIHTHGSGEDTVFMPASTHEQLMEVIQSDDGPEESMGSSSVAGNSNDEEPTTMDNISETDVAVLEAAESLDEPVEALEEYAATEEPTIVDGSTYESMRGVLEDALSEKADLKDDTIEALAFGALVDEFRTEDGELEAEALVQNPESGDAPSAESGVEALGDDADTEKAEALYEDYQRFETDGLQDDICEALGVNDWDTAVEVLD